MAKRVSKKAIKKAVKKVVESDYSGEDLLAYWQDRLGLQDWKITLEVARRADMDGSVGRCHWDLPEKIATISLADQWDLYGEKEPYKDQERTLVHELVHILMVYEAQPAPESVEYILREQVINKLAEALVEK